MWRNSLLHRLTALVFLAALVPASVLVGGSLWLNARTQQEMARRVDETLDLAINLQQSLLDADLTRMQDRAVSLAASPLLLPAVTGGPALTTLLDTARAALPVADLVTVVDRAGIVRGRAGATATGERIRYGGLVDQVLNAATPIAAVTVIPRADLAGEPRNVVSQVRLPVTPTAGATDPGVGAVLEDALALVGAAPVLDPAGRVIGAVLVADILNNDNRLVDEVANLSPHGMPMHATIALNNIRIATNVPAPGAGHRAVGTLFSDPVITRLRAGQEFRGRALVGGWQWERAVYLPLTDYAGRVLGGSFVGVPEANFAALTRWTTLSTWVALAVAVAGLSGAVLLARRLAKRSVVRPLARFTQLLNAGDLQSHLVSEEDIETAQLADALNVMTDRIRRTVSEVGGVAEGVRAVSDTLEVVARQTAGDAARALAVAGDALSAAETVGAATSRAAGRMRELELALTRIDAATEEEARAIKHAGTVVTEVNAAVHDSRQTLAGVLEATRAVVAAAQQGRHSALRTVAALELIRLPGSADAHLAEDLERGQAAANECDAALREIAREADEARNQLWDVAGALTESGAMAGAVARQLTDISAVVDETAHSSHTMSAASREIISEVEAMAAGTDAALSLVRQARAHVTSIAEANQRLLELSERIGRLARELDAVTSAFPRAL